MGEPTATAEFCLLGPSAGDFGGELKMVAVVVVMVVLVAMVESGLASLTSLYRDKRSDQIWENQHHSQKKMMVAT